ncbi:hypothetical protein AAFF_G00361030, partial [Aldrovandia affinis]
MLLIYAGVRIVSAVVEWQQWDSLRFGEYGKTAQEGGRALNPQSMLKARFPPAHCTGEPVQCRAWAGQCALYILIMMFEKVLIILVLLIPQLKQALMFWVVDNFLMKKSRTKAKDAERDGGPESCGSSKILISADDEMDEMNESDGQEDLRGSGFMWRPE